MDTQTPNSPKDLMNLNGVVTQSEVLEKFLDLNLDEALNFVQECVDHIHGYHQQELHNKSLDDDTPFQVVGIWQRDTHHLLKAMEHLQLVTRGGPGSDVDDEDEEETA